MSEPAPQAQITLEELQRFAAAKKLRAECVECGATKWEVIGAFVGALPGACSALETYIGKRTIEVPSLVTLVICLTALILAVVMYWMGKRPSTVNDDIFKRIMARSAQ